ncbi:MAG: hypothetical protein AAF549_01435 [Pseudomonadota bacterium]
MSLIQARHQLAIIFVKAVNPKAPTAEDNIDLLDKILTTTEFTTNLLEDALNDPWRMQSIYTAGQEPLEALEGKATFHCWTLPNSDAAGGSLSILTSLKPFSGKKAMLPVSVYIPEKLIGARINADITGTGSEAYNVVGVGWGTTFSCCSSEQAVDFHLVYKKDGEFRSQPRPSSIECGDGVKEAYNEPGLVQFVGEHPLHAIQHKIYEARNLGSHCGHKHELTSDTVAQARPVAP